MSAKVVLPRERTGRRVAVLAWTGIAMAVLLLAITAVLALSPASRGTARATSRSLIEAKGGTGEPTSAPSPVSVPELVVHYTGSIDGQPPTEQWVDPASGTRRTVIHDASGTVVSENGWSAASGEFWSVDHRARTVLRRQAPSPVADVSAALQSQYAGIEEKLASGAAAAEGYESHGGVNALRIRQVNPGGDVVTSWLDTTRRRLLGVTTASLHVDIEHFDGDAAAGDALLMPDVTGYQRVDSMPTPRIPGISAFGA
jgi:hypothetical protein